MKPKPTIQAAPKTQRAMNPLVVAISLSLGLLGGCSTDPATDTVQQTGKADDLTAIEESYRRDRQAVLVDKRESSDGKRPALYPIEAPANRPLAANEQQQAAIRKASKQQTAQQRENDAVILVGPNSNVMSDVDSMTVVTPTVEGRTERLSSELVEQEHKQPAQDREGFTSAELSNVAKVSHGAQANHGDVQTVQSLPPQQSMATVQAADIRHAQEELYRERYQRPEDNQVVRVSETPVSTFSIDVDTGAYTNMRRFLSQGQLPPHNAVRVEEFINYFDYAYPTPQKRGQPFVAHTEIAATPWNPQSHLLRIGIQGYELPVQQMPPSNLVFLIDVSGSMQSHDKLPLLKQALGLLTQQMRPQDSVSMVVYAGASGVVLPPTSGKHKARIHQALAQLQAGGSTNGASGIRLAYQLAKQNFRLNGVNRVILATDGDFNVGMASTDELIDLIQRNRDDGIALTTLGFGSGNYNDHLLEQLADEGNGNHAYIDRLSEAQKVLGQQLSSTLVTIAKDVKIQIEFNPATVSEYRLIGYENRALNEDDFNNDRVDAGDIGAGHRVTALYEITLSGASAQRLPARRYGESARRTMQPEQGFAMSDELAFLKIRYKDPDAERSKLIETPILRQHMHQRLASASGNFRFAAAVAAFGQKLRGGQYLESFGYQDIAELARHARGADPHGYRSEFLQLVTLAEALDPDASVAYQTLED